MPTVPINDEVILKEYQLNCYALKTEKMKMLLVKQNLTVLNKKNEITSKGLSQLKTEYDLYKTHLYKTLFNLKVETDKQKILSRKKLNEFMESKKRTEEYFKMSPIKFELEELIKRNHTLEEECRRKANLLELTKQQYEELLSVLMKTFQNKLFEFCLTALEHDLVKLSAGS